MPPVCVVVGVSCAQDEYVDANRAVLTPQFWLLWIILCMNVSCGIGVLSQASPIVQVRRSPLPYHHRYSLPDLCRAG